MRRTNRNYVELIAAVVGLAKGLSLRTIAEGVENERQARFLLACGCEEGQGHLYSAALDAPEFERRYNI